jgi:hypothetical protein
MSTDTSPAVLRGFSIPLQTDSSWIWTSEASYTQQQPQAGVPVSDTTDGVVLTAQGTQATGTSYEVITVQGGTVADRATYAWREGGSGDYYGADGAGTISHFETIYSAGSAALYPHAVGLPDGSVLCVYQYNVGKQVQLSTWSESAGWSESTIANFSALIYPFMTDLYPTICRLSDGSLLVAHYYGDTAAGVATIRTLRSTDDGATWSQHSSDTLRTAIDIAGSPGSGATGYDLLRLRMAAVNGQILLLAGVNAHDTDTSRLHTLQYASNDNGLTFELVDTIDDSGAVTTAYSPDVTVQGGAFYVSINDNGTVYSIALSNAFESINTAYSSKVTVAGGLATNQNSCMWTDDRGFMYAVLRSNTTNNPIRIFASIDGGSNFQQIVTNLYSVGTNLEFIKELAGCSVGGRQLLVSNSSSTDGTLDDAVLGHWLGGYSSVTLPPESPVSLGISDWIGWSAAWSAFWLPDDGTWAKTFLGTPVISASGMTLTTTTALNSRAYWSQTPTTDAIAGLIVRTRLTASTGGTTGSNRRTIRLRYSDTTTHEVLLRIAPTGYAVYDGNTTQIGGSISADLTTGVELLIALADGQVCIWRRSANLDAHARQWTLDFNQSAVPAGGTASNLVQFGHESVASGPNTVTVWHEFHYSADTDTGLQLAYGQTNPDQLHGAGYPAEGQAVYIDQGLLISTRGGYAAEGQTNTIDTRYLYPIDNIFHSYSPTPRTQWRSTSVAPISNVPSQMIPIYTNLNVGSTEGTRLDSDLLCVHLENINFSQFTIEYYDTGTSSWVVLADIDTALTTNYVRHGANVRWNTGGGSGTYYHYDTLVGGYVVLGVRTTGKYRTISANTEGVWDSPSYGKQSVITLSDIDGTEGSSGAITIIPPRATVVVNLLGISTPAIAIRTDAQRTTTGDIRIGHLSIGNVYVLAPQYGRGRAIEYITNTTNTLQPDGTQRTRVRSNGHRAVQVAWTDGIDITQQYASTPDLNYWASEDTNQQPVANYGSVPFDLLGIVERLRGAHHPVVYLPYIQYATTVAGETRTLTDKQQAILCTLQSDVSIDHVVGSEFDGTAGEVFRVATLTLEEVE